MFYPVLISRHVTVELSRHEAVGSSVLFYISYVMMIYYEANGTSYAPGKVL